VTSSAHRSEDAYVEAILDAFHRIRPCKVSLLVEYPELFHAIVRLSAHREVQRLIARKAAARRWRWFR
jgi:hypothetical protein